MVEFRDIDIIVNNQVEWNKFENKNVLVTGATGRLGIYIVEALCEANIRWNLNITVYACVRNVLKAEKVFKESLKLPFLELIVQDITEPFKIESQIDYIFHTAGLASPDDFTTRPVETLWGHLSGTKNILDLAKEKNAKKVLYVSTVEVYGSWNNDKLISETDMGPIKCDNARSCYPEAKRMCETMLASYKAQYGIDYVAVRMSHTIGPGISLTDGRAFAEFIYHALKGEDIVLYSDGSAVRTYTYTADAVGAMFLLMTKGTHGYYNVAALNNQISIRDLAKLISELAPSNAVKVKFDKNATNGLEYLPFKLGVMDTSRVEELGWKPKVNIKDMFKWTMESFSDCSNINKKI